MYRHRFYVQVKYGHFKENLMVWEQLNELARSRGWPESTFWAPTVGTANEFIVETDYRIWRLSSGSPRRSLPIPRR